MLVSIVILAIGVAITAALLGSAAYSYFAPINEIVLSPLEKKCQQIANEGYQIHALYPNSHPDDLPESERNRMLSLDEIWMKECVAVLPAETIFDIVNNVERDLSFGE